MQTVVHCSKNLTSTSSKIADLRQFWERNSNYNKKYHSGGNVINSLVLDEVPNPLRFQCRPSAGFPDFFLMSSMEFERLLTMIGPIISKKEANYWRVVPIQRRLGLTLRFLVNRESFHSLAYAFKIPEREIEKVVLEICDAITEALHECIKVPKNEPDWKKVAILFNKKWNFPNCLGVIDGKQIIFRKPVNNNEVYKCKGFFRVIVFAIIDSDYNFIYANTVSQDGLSNGGIFRETKYRKVLAENSISLPPDCPLPGRTVTTPFVFLADDAFPLLPNVMKKYPGSYSITSRKRAFNHRLNRGRFVSVNTFGMISAAFQILQKPILLHPEMAKKVILVIIHMHNFLKKSPSKHIYNHSGNFGQEFTNHGILKVGAWEQDESIGFSTFTAVPRKSTSYAESVRNHFTEYFNSPEGKLT